MNVLFIGNLRLSSNQFFAKLDKENKYVVYNDQDKDELTGENVINYKKEGKHDEDLQKMFATFDFDTVIYFSCALDGAKKVYDELEKLESAIYVSRRYKIKNFIYIATNDMLTERISTGEKSRDILLNACEQMCRSFTETSHVNFLMIKVPYLYSKGNKKNQLMQWIRAGNRGEEIWLHGAEYTETDFLCDEDLAELLNRVLDEPIEAEYTEMHLSGDNRITFSELAEMIKKNIPDAQIVFKNYIECIPCCYKDNLARTEYGWFPKQNLEDDIAQMVVENVEKAKKKRIMRERRRRYQKIQDRIRVIIELIVLVVLAEVLNFYTKDNVLINFIDFRLVSVVLMGTMNGLNPGVVAAVLSSLGYIISNSAKMQWQIIFYNVENWLPFACYFLLGAIAGYTRDKYDDDIIYAKEEHALLEKKYTFLNELYNRVLESKDNFNSQIIGYKDSFGKVYSVVKKLDALLPDQVFYEAVNTLEELLENYTVAIYTINRFSDFARLNVCSKSMNHVLNKSLKMSDYPEMMKCLREKRGFVNTACLPDYPSYGAAIHKNDELTGMILLMNCTNQQMNTEFANKFNIISDLISNALIRAMEFEQYSDSYIEGTQILQVNKFKEILAIKEQMQEKQYMSYLLLRILPNGMELPELSERVCRLVRNNDIVGMGEDKQIYLLLSQTRREDLTIIEERMKKNGIMLEVVKG